MLTRADHQSSVKHEATKVKAFLTQAIQENNPDHLAAAMLAMNLVTHRLTVLEESCHTASKGYASNPRMRKTMALASDQCNDALDKVDEVRTRLREGTPDPSEWPQLLKTWTDVYLTVVQLQLVPPILERPISTK